MSRNRIILFLVLIVAAAAGIIFGTSRLLAPPPRNADWTPVSETFDGVAMVQVPAGCVTLGMADYPDETPQSQVCFERSFWIDQVEVSQAQFAQFGGTAERQPSFSGDDLPVEGLTFYEARDFCALRGARLPTEAEWEYAARGPEGVVYPWGNEWNPDALVWQDTANEQTAPVGSYPAGASWVGALNMVGNVREWVSSRYDPYPYDAADGREDASDQAADADHPARILRGGAWSGDEPVLFRASNRQREGVPDSGTNTYGVRCARDA